MATATEKNRENKGIFAIVPPDVKPGARIRLVKAAHGLPAGAVLRFLPGKNRAETTSIGTVEPKTDRLILQQPKTPEKIQDLASGEHETVKSAIEDALRGIDGAKLYADRGEKDPERVAEKAESGQSPRTMRDYSGFRVAVETPQAWKQAARALREHFEVPDEQDEFEKGSPVNFHGHTVQVRMPGSKVTHEVQILPREQAENADGDHHLYEAARDGDKKAERRLKDANRAHWIAFLDRNQQAKYKLGNTQIDIDPDSPAGKALEAVRAKISDDDLAGKGEDVGGSHVTVRYGIEDESDPEKTREFLRQQAPFTITLGATAIFPPSPSSEGAAVVMAPVESPELERLHAEIKKHATFAPSNFPDYRPHGTVAYVKPAAAKKYAGLTGTTGKQYRVDAICLTFRDGTEDAVKLAGTAREGGRGESPERESGAGQKDTPAPGSVPAKSASVPQKPATGSPRTVMGEKLRAALEKKQPSLQVAISVQAAPPPARATSPFAPGACFVAPDGNGGVAAGKVQPDGSCIFRGAPAFQMPPGAIPVRVSDAMLQPVTGTPEESRQLAMVKPALAQWVADYLERYTAGHATMIAADAAKEMLPAFQQDPAANDMNVMAAAGAIRDGALNTLLSAPVDRSRDQVLVVVGSPGSGKTTSLALGADRPGIGIRIEAIPEDASKFALMLRKIIASGRRPVVEWVWAGTAKATASRMILRAAGDGQRPGIGRVVQTGYMAKAWCTLPKVLDQVRREMGSRVVWLLADNSGPPGTEKVTPDIGAWLRRGDAMKETAALAQMNGELDLLQRRQRIQGTHAQKLVDAARQEVATMPRTEILDVPLSADDLKEKARSLAAARDSGKATAAARAAETSAWKRAGSKLRDDPAAQVPF